MDLQIEKEKLKEYAKKVKGVLWLLGTTFAAFLLYAIMVVEAAGFQPPDEQTSDYVLLEIAVWGGPLAIRYPRSGKVLIDGENTSIQVGKWEYVHKSHEKPAKVTVLATGERSLIIAMKALNNLKKQGKEFDIVNARFVKPLDDGLLQTLQSEYVVTVEDNALLGGFGSMVTCALNQMQKPISVKCFAYRDEFIPQGKIADLQAEYGVNCTDIEKYILDVL